MRLPEYDGEEYTNNVRAEDRAKGEIKAIISYMRDRFISEEQVAQRANVTLEDFRKAEALYCYWKDALRS